MSIQPAERAVHHQVTMVVVRKTRTAAIGRGLKPTVVRISRTREPVFEGPLRKQPSKWANSDYIAFPRSAPCSSPNNSDYSKQPCGLDSSTTAKPRLPANPKRGSAGTEGSSTSYMYIQSTQRRPPPGNRGVWEQRYRARANVHPTRRTRRPPPGNHGCSPKNSDCGDRPRAETNSSPNFPN